MVANHHNMKLVFVALALPALLAAACAGQLPPSAAEEADIQTEAGGLDDGAASAVLPLPYPVPIAESCDPQNPEAWIALQRKMYKERAAGQRLGPPAPTAPNCRAYDFDRACTSICDCTYGHIRPCVYEAVSRHQPWRSVSSDPFTQTSGKDKEGLCTAETGNSCGGFVPTDHYTFACIAGQCRLRLENMDGKGDWFPNESNYFVPSPTPPPAPLPATTTIACDPGDPSPYISELYQRLLWARMAFTAADQGVCDAICKPKIERACETVCDCKFILANCKVQGATRNAQGSFWTCNGPPTHEGDKGKTCHEDRMCNHLFQPGTCAPSLACVQGQCVATPGPGSTTCTGP